MINALMKLGIEGMYHNIIKAIHDKPIANIILNGEKSGKIFPKLRDKKRCVVFPLLFNSHGITSQRNKA
jgi:hypothetical protein